MPYRWLVALAVASGLGIVACDGARSRPEPDVREAAAGPAVEKPREAAPPRDERPARPAEIGKPLYLVAALPAAVEPPARPRRAVADPVVIPDCRISVIEKEEVPSQRDGVLLVIGTDVKPGETVPPDRLIRVKIGGEEKRFRILREGDTVEADQLLAHLDSRLAYDDWLIKEAKVTASKADEEAADKTRDEAKVRYERRERLSRTGGGTSVEEADAARLAWQRYICEAVSKHAGVTLAERERNQAQTTLRMNEIRSAIPGVIKTIYKKRGEYVKSAEAVFQIQNLSRLRLEGLVEVQYLPRLRLGMQVAVEDAPWLGPQQALTGHLQAITGVAVSRDRKNPLVVSASEDGTARVWDRAERRERVLRHPGPVWAVACAPAAAEGDWCVTGGEDGKVRLWDLAHPDQEARVFKDQHRQPVRCLAFSPDGKTCASGGDDLEICLWDVATGDLRYRFPPGHRAAITALQFTPQARLVSAGQDNTIRLWSVGEQGARLEETLDRRSGDVSQPGVSPDGKVVLFDQGKTLRLLALEGGSTRGVLKNPSGAANFTTFALFSPDARLVLTAGGSEGRLTLWRTPVEAGRGAEFRQLVPGERSSATCAAFAPDGSFLVTGTREGQVLVWPVPGGDTEPALTATVTLVERVVESSAHQVRVWAELQNPEGRLIPGTTANLVIPGE